MLGGAGIIITGLMFSVLVREKGFYFFRNPVGFNGLIFNNGYTLLITGESDADSFTVHVNQFFTKCGNGVVFQ